MLSCLHLAVKKCGCSAPTPLPHLPCHFLFLFVHHSQEAFAQKLGTHSLPPGTSLWVQYVQIVCLGLLSIRAERRSGSRFLAASEARVSASPLPVRSKEFCGRAAVTAARSARPGDHTKKDDHHWPFSRRPIFHRKRGFAQKVPNAARVTLCLHF
jgi:hypothetical protein